MAPSGRPDTINAEVFTLTYGSIVKQLLIDLHDITLVNAKLDEMGHKMGVRLVEEFLAKSKQASCADFGETAEAVATQAFPMFLGVKAQLTDWNQERTRCTLLLPDNPLADYVALPPEYESLQYNQVLCGVIRGALEMVNLQVEAKITKDTLHNDDTTAIELRLVSAGIEVPPFGDD